MKKMTTKKKILILGGGQQGKLIANTLDKYTKAKVVIADNRKVELDNKNIETVYFDANDVNGKYQPVFGYFMKQFDVVVGCLPSHLGSRCVAVAAEYGVNYVDLSFTEEDLSKYNSLAKQTGAVIIPDSGVAPGLPNLIIGHLLGQREQLNSKILEPINIYVGGNAFDTSLPLGYVKSWSLEDLFEEYFRNGRFIENGLVKSVSPLELSALKKVKIYNREYEAFTSDGLRSLLKLSTLIPNMREYTLRYPGHMEAVESMMRKCKYDKKCFVRLFEEVISKEREKDLIDFSLECGNKTYILQVIGDEKTSAMAKATGYMCASVAELLCEDKYFSLQPGVHNLEDIGSNIDCYKFVRNKLENRGIYVKYFVNKIERPWV